ncbi:hypothetical protein ES332_D11G085500v1 [Gossypium tomentosum]|uniref:Uncharacterized protein n=1 Tax=Gossypium tomentosum TaxID=34277 RepID=A0A5D2IKS0_GOSTO|nr:hypothetical protein ES332_D11G085500v1 [Gossypium tomentosum]
MNCMNQPKALINWIILPSLHLSKTQNAVVFGFSAPSGKQTKPPEFPTFSLIDYYIE